MRLPSFKRIFENDFAQEDRDLVRKLANSLNVALENVYLALGNRLTLSDNFQATIKEVDIIVNAQGIPVTNTTFQLDKFGSTQTGSDARIIGLLVLRATNLSNSASFVTSAPFLTWTQTQTGVQIQHVTGLTPGQTFRLTIVALS